MNYKEKLRKVSIFWGSFFLLNALLYNKYILSFISSRFLLFGEFSPEIEKSIFFIQLLYLLCAFLFVGFAMQKKCGPQSLFSYLFIVFLSTPIILFFLSELALIPFFDTKSIYEYDKDLGWKLKANVNGRILGTKIKTNAKGLRGQEISYFSKNKKILYLGDSVTFGYMIADDQKTFPYKIEQLLEQKLKQKIDTINAGVCGYSPTQEYLFLIKEGIKYKPDLVIISVVLNDISDKIFLNKGEHNNVNFESLHVDKKNTWQDTRMSFFIKMTYAHMTRRKNYFKVNKSLCDDPSHKKYEQYIQKTIDELTKINLFCEKNKIPTLFVFFPCLYQLQSKLPKITPQKIIIKKLLNTNCLDLLDSYHKNASGKGWRNYFLDFWHPTEQGYELAAKRMVRYLLVNNLIFKNVSKK